MRSRPYRVVALSFFVFAWVIGSSPGPAVANGHINCDPVGTAHVDPIAFHRESPPTGHGHQFFGNQKLLTLSNPNAATYDELVAAGTSCENPADSAAYWAPVLRFTDGRGPVTLRETIAYYRGATGGDRDPSANPLPQDARLIAGPPDGSYRISWSCDQRSSRPGPYQDITEAACHTATGTVFLTARIHFPGCWTGRLNPHGNGMTADYDGAGRVTNQFTYGQRSDGTCPTGFPLKTTEATLNIKYDYQGDGSDIKLSSDKVGQEPGASLHADLWNTWEQAGFETMIDRCVRRNLDDPAVCGHSHEGFVSRMLPGNG